MYFIYNIHTIISRDRKQIILKKIPKNESREMQFENFDQKIIKMYLPIYHMTQKTTCPKCNIPNAHIFFNLNKLMFPKMNHQKYNFVEIIILQVIDI